MVRSIVGELKWAFHSALVIAHLANQARSAGSLVSSVNTPDPSHKCSLYSSGYTAIQDINFDRSSGRLYVYELAEDGVMAFEARVRLRLFRQPCSR